MADLLPPERKAALVDAVMMASLGRGQAAGLVEAILLTLAAVREQERARLIEAPPAPPRPLTEAEIDECLAAGHAEIKAWPSAEDLAEERRDCAAVVNEGAKVTDWDSRLLLAWLQTAAEIRARPPAPSSPPSEQPATGSNPDVSVYRDDEAGVWVGKFSLLSQGETPADAASAVLSGVEMWLRVSRERLKEQPAEASAPAKPLLTEWKPCGCGDWKRYLDNNADDERMAVVVKFAGGFGWLLHGEEGDLLVRGDADTLADAQQFADAAARAHYTLPGEPESAPPPRTEEDEGPACDRCGTTGCPRLLEMRNAGGRLYDLALEVCGRRAEVARLTRERDALAARLGERDKEIADCWCVLDTTPEDSLDMGGPHLVGVLRWWQSEEAANYKRADEERDRERARAEAAERERDEIRAGLRLELDRAVHEDHEQAVEERDQARAELAAARPIVTAALTLSEAGCCAACGAWREDPHVTGCELVSLLAAVAALRSPPPAAHEGDENHNTNTKEG